MAVIGLRLSADLTFGPEVNGRSALEGLNEALLRTPKTAPVVVMIHGFRFNHAQRVTDPHRLIYALDPEISGRRVASWPRGLGFNGENPHEGLCIGFSWQVNSRNPLFRAASFAKAYKHAALIGAELGRLLDYIAALDPGRKVDIFAHSLGVRVALQAARTTRTAPGRVILMGAAEYSDTALQSVENASRETEFYNITSRQNDFYDFLFRTFAPRQAPQNMALGAGMAQAPGNWIDLQLDRFETEKLLKRRNVSLGGRTARSCHWSFYTRDGVMAMYRGILRSRHNWCVNQLRLEQAQAGPVPQANRPQWPDFGANAGIREV